MKNLKSIILTAVMLLSLFSIRCSNILGIDPKPEVTEREVNFQLVLKDNSGLMNSIYGTDFVRNATVTLKSNFLGEEYTFESDSNGVINVNKVISDVYLVTANRIITPEEMVIASGTAASNVKLTNKNNRIIELNASNNNLIVVEMEMIVGSSPLIISEIYASGPSGSGLYYHDKYVEIFNQTDSVLYLDGLIIAVVYYSGYLGLNFVNDPAYIHSKSIWSFPGNGTDYPIQPGQFILCAQDAIDHRINAPNSVDLSHADFEFYKDDAPDVDNPAIPNMIRIYQDAGNDWLIAGERGALVLAKFSADSLLPYDDHFLIPYTAVLDGVEYLDDPTRLDKKILNQGIDAGATGSIQFYTGKSMERLLISDLGRKILKDENNSSVDFKILTTPSPGRYHQ
ncbi:MAG: DUF4876 domain-containing protein [Ignavibacteria bacterium]|nr:DUF4876 domain-containing protein [Ignavibacteria bacterium]